MLPCVKLSPLFCSWARSVDCSAPGSTPATRKMPAPQLVDWEKARANETSLTLLPSAWSVARKLGSTACPRFAPAMLVFVAADPQTVLGSSASRSLASLGRLGRAKLGRARLGAAADAAPSEDVAADGSAADASTDAGAAWDAAADAAPVEGI